MKLHDITTPGKHPGVPLMTESALATVGIDQLGDLRDIWIENDWVYGLWTHRASGLSFVVHLHDLEYERHHYPADFEYMKERVEEVTRTGGEYAYYMYAEYTLKPDRTPTNPYRGR